MAPLRMTTWQRQLKRHPIEPGKLIGRADAGSQCTSIMFTEHLELEGSRLSIWTVADAYDNARIKTVIGLLSTECIRTTVFHAGPFGHLSDVTWSTTGWVD